MLESDEEANEFLKALAEFDYVDENLWRYGIS